MTLPDKADKGYLEITPDGEGFLIIAQKQHADELGPLFEQRGIPCHREAGVQPGMDALRFTGDATLARAVLEGYKTAKGS